MLAGVCPDHGYREPALSNPPLTVEGASVTFWTLFSPRPCRATETDGSWIVESDCWRRKFACVWVNNPVCCPAVAFTGTSGDTLEIP